MDICGQIHSQFHSDLDSNETLGEKFTHKSYVRYNVYKRDFEKNNDRGVICPNAYGGARGVMVIVGGNGHGNTSSNPGRGW